MPRGTINHMNRVDDLSRKRAALLLVAAVFLAATVVVTWPMRFVLPGVASAPAAALPTPLAIADIAPTAGPAPTPKPDVEAAQVVRANVTAPDTRVLALQVPRMEDSAAEPVPELAASRVMVGVLAPMAVPDAVPTADAAVPAHGAVTRAVATAGRQIGVAVRVTGGAIRAAF